MSDYYWVDEKMVPYPIDLHTWATKFRDEDRVVSRDTVGDADISTVFLGMDHSFGGGPPHLWETLIFGGDYDGHMWRYTSYEAAINGHVNVVKDVMVGTEPDAKTDAG